RPADELWDRYSGHVPSGRHLHRSNSQGYEARRPAGLAVHQIRTRHQPANGEGTRHRGAQLLTVARRRGNRMIRRREFITVLGGAAAWPLAARAQQSGKLPTIGFLGQSTRLATSEWTAAFVQRLRELGWIDSRNVAIEYRWGEGRNERFAQIAAE